eukprot:Gb_01367 [translate_table: standard]
MLPRNPLCDESTLPNSGTPLDLAGCCQLKKVLNISACQSRSGCFLEACCHPRAIFPTVEAQDEGIEPVKRLEDKSRNVKLHRLPVSWGIFPPIKLFGNGRKLAHCRRQHSRELIAQKVALAFQLANEFERIMDDEFPNRKESTMIRRTVFLRMREQWD